ncbi:unnamed protein product [Cuscuta epithymum]|uniref:Uncharacterized protein n=1 Tax=Cuscuta epithymum TaxID=186058 RepID=A0AAV0G4A7_9ASTE|nr:unnamed protein product [Cuscuta epithymum]
MPRKLVGVDDSAGQSRILPALLQLEVWLMLCQLLGEAWCSGVDAKNLGKTLSLIFVATAVYWAETMLSVLLPSEIDARIRPFNRWWMVALRRMFAGAMPICSHWGSHAGAKDAADRIDRSRKMMRPISSLESFVGDADSCLCPPASSINFAVP